MILGVGIDVVDLARAERLLARFGERALTRLCTPGEAAYIRARAHPSQHFAARLAAKEAAFKALGGGAASAAIGWRDIEVASAPDGSPALRCVGAAAARAEAIGASRLHVSLTHSALTALAVVIVER